MFVQVHTPSDAAEPTVITIDRIDRVSRSAISRKVVIRTVYGDMLFPSMVRLPSPWLFLEALMFCSNQAHISPGTSDNPWTGDVGYGRKEECSNFHHDSGRQHATEVLGASSPQTVKVWVRYGVRLVSRSKPWFYPTIYVPPYDYYCFPLT